MLIKVLWVDMTKENAERERGELEMNKQRE